MAVKLTKNELKLQKDRLRQFERYLPTLMLKKQQLQLVIQQIEREIETHKKEQAALIAQVKMWIAVYAENERYDLLSLVQIDTILKSKSNIAGVIIPTFKELTFKHIEYNPLLYPLWIDKGVSFLREVAQYDALIATLNEQIELLGRELRVTSQRVNLFEKVKIPEAKEHIRLIGIYLGDQQTAAVVRGKIAKKKLVAGA
ncbi:MAG TPA: V-type ATP synthase subunit D [Sphaerochaeta sp.]|jgi:V/A-type H+-transporting ATPase subunit D|nr:V-type ATP synthase subunit D [Spirochaetales bacterium]HPX28939.1 V-type ATP synthase subunit D [Sphaerochaeta sp.]HQB54001.1 V-type ATP synthase subunit D [Sphaerochaeta sp.]